MPQNFKPMFNFHFSFGVNDNSANKGFRYDREINRLYLMKIL